MKLLRNNYNCANYFRLNIPLLTHQSHITFMIQGHKKYAFIAKQPSIKAIRHKKAGEYEEVSSATDPQSQSTSNTTAQIWSPFYPLNNNKTNWLAEID